MTAVDHLARVRSGLDDLLSAAVRLDASCRRLEAAPEYR
jgi:hypothetical protein